VVIMKNIIFSFFVLVSLVSAQEYIYTWETEAVRTACPPYAVSVNVSDRDPNRNPAFEDFNNRLKQFTHRKFPILNEPEGSLFALADGIAGKTLEEIATKRAALDPIVYTRPLEAPALIVVSATNNYGIGITADDEGNILTFRAHSSPYDPSVAQSNRAAAIAKARNDRNKAKAGVNGQIQQRVENLERLLGVRP